MTTTITLTPATVKVGDGVTEPIGSDRYAGTVTFVSPSGKTIRFTRDKATANGPVHDREQYDYSYESTEPASWFDPYMGHTTNERKAIWNERRQAFVPVGSKSRLISGRHQYYDPSF